MPDYSQRNYWLRRAQQRGLSSQMRSYFTQKAAEQQRKLRDAVQASGRQLNGRTAQQNAAERAASGKQTVDTSQAAYPWFATKAAWKGMFDQDAKNVYKATLDYGKARMVDSLLAPIQWVRGKKFDLQQNYQDYLDDYWRQKLGRNYEAVQNGAQLVGAGAATLATAPLTTARVVSKGGKAAWDGIKAIKKAVPSIGAASDYIHSGKAALDSAKALWSTMGKVQNGIQATEKAFRAFPRAIKAGAQGGLYALKSGWNTARQSLSSIPNAWRTADQAIQSASRTVQNSAKATPDAILSGIGKGIGGIWNGVKAAPGAAWNGIKAIPKATLNSTLATPAKYRSYMRMFAMGKGVQAASQQLKALLGNRSTNITYTGDTPQMVKQRIARGQGFFPEGITTPEQKQAYIKQLVNWQVRHTDTGSTAASMTQQFAAPFAAGGAGSLLAKGLGFIPGVKYMAPVLSTAGFLGTAYALPNAQAQKASKAQELFGALAQTAQKTDVKPMRAYYQAYQAQKDPAKKALLARQMVQKAYKDRMFSSVLANKQKQISNTGNRGIIPSYLAAKKLQRGQQLTPNQWQGIIDSQDIPYFGNIVQQKLQQGTQQAVNKFGTDIQTYIQAYSKEQDPTKRQQLASQIAQKITANRMPNFIRNQLIEGKIRGNQPVGGVKQQDIDKGVFGKLSVQQMKAAPKAGKQVLQQMQQLPDTRDVYQKYTDPTVVQQLQYMGQQGAYNWFNQKIDDPNTDVYEVGQAALQFQRAFNLSDQRAQSSPITKKLKQKCTAQVFSNPDNVRKAVSLWIRSKGLDGFADFLKNPISFYGMLAVLIGAPLLMGLSAGQQVPQQPVRSYQYKPLTGMQGTGSSYADALI